VYNGGRLAAGPGPLRRLHAGPHRRRSVPRRVRVHCAGAREGRQDAGLRDLRPPPRMPRRRRPPDFAGGVSVRPQIHAPRGRS